MFTDYSGQNCLSFVALIQQSFLIYIFTPALKQNNLSCIKVLLGICSALLHCMWHLRSFILMYTLYLQWQTDVFIHKHECQHRHGISRVYFITNDCIIYKPQSYSARFNLFGFAEINRVKIIHTLTSVVLQVAKYLLTCHKLLMVLIMIDYSW